MGKVYLYARVSTQGQNLDAQVDDLKKAYPDARLFMEKKSGTQMKNRVELQRVLDLLDEGDKLVVWALDRLGRSNVDLAALVAEIRTKGAFLHVLKQNIDTSDKDSMNSTMTNMFLGMLGVFAEFETNLRSERQAIGIAKAKEEGKYLGGKKHEEKRKRIVQGLQMGMKTEDIVRFSGAGRNTVFRVKRELKEKALWNDQLESVRELLPVLEHPKKIAKAMGIHRSRANALVDAIETEEKKQ